jgi:tetratricopeptide (TPR) repeat protein
MLKKFLLVYFILISSYVFAQDRQFYLEMEKNYTNDILYFHQNIQMAFRMRAYARLNLDKNTEALSDCDSALKYLSSDYMSMTYKGIAYNNLNKYRDGILAFNKSIKYKIDFSDSYLNRGISYYYLGMLNKAMDDFNKTISFNNEDLYARYYRGIIYLEHKEFKKAILDFSIVLKISPFMIQAINKRIISYYNFGNFTEAINDAQKSISIDSLNPLPYKYMGLILIEENKVIEGCQYLKKSESLGLKVEEDDMKKCR